MKKNNDNTPIKRQRGSYSGISDWLDYSSIAKAGQPVDLTGEAIVQLGALFTQMDFGLKDEEGDANTAIDSVGTGAKKKPLDEGKDYTDFGKEYDYMSQLIMPDLLGKGITTKADEKPLDTPENKTEIINDSPQSSFGTFMQPGGSFINNPFVIPELEPEKSYYRPSPRGSFAPSVFNRLTEETLNALNGLRYTNKEENDTPLRRVIHAMQSPFLQTDGIDYRQLKRAVIPEYAKGRLGAAAAEGFNLVIDKYNYDQAVKADYEEELDDQMGSLNVEADFVSDEARKNYLELGFQKKKELFDAFNNYTKGNISYLDYKNKAADLKSEVEAAAAARTNLTKLREEYLEKKGTYDIDASDKEMVDFYNTLEKNPEALSIKSIGGVDYVTGNTRGNKSIKVPVSKIANGTAGFRLVEKENLAPIMNGALQLIDKYRQDVKTKFGYGQATASPEKAKEIGVAYIKNNLASNENKLRSYMAQAFGVDHNLYQQLIASDGNISEEMLNDAAEELYDNQIGNIYFQQQKTTKFDAPQKTVGSTAGERTQKQLSDYYNTLGTPSATNILDYQANIENFPNKYQVLESEDGRFGIVKSDKPDEFISMLDFSNPEQVKKIMFSFGGLKPYSLPTKK